MCMYACVCACVRACMCVCNVGLPCLASFDLNCLSHSYCQFMLVVSQHRCSLYLKLLQCTKLCIMLEVCAL